MIAKQSFWGASASHPPQAHYKNAEGVLSSSLGLARFVRAYPRYPSFLPRLYAAGVASGPTASASQSASHFQLKIKNSTLKISPKNRQGNARPCKRFNPLPPRHPLALRPQPPAFPTKPLIFNRFAHHSIPQNCLNLPQKTCEL